MNGGGSAGKEIDALERRVGDAEIKNGFRIVTPRVKLSHELRRNARAAHAREAFDLRHVGDRHDAGNDRHVDARPPSSLDEREVLFVVEEELRREKLGARLDFAAKIAEIGGFVGSLEVLLRIASAPHAEDAALARETHELVRVREAAFDGCER